MNLRLFMLLYRGMAFLLAVGMVYAPPPVSRLMTATIGAALVFELFGAARPVIARGRAIAAGCGSFCAILMSTVGIVTPVTGGAVAWLVATCCLAAGASRQASPRYHDLLAIVPPATALIVVALPAADPARWREPMALLVLLLALGVQDGVAMAAGRRLGGLRPFPRVSPTKTVSGSIAGLIAGLVFLRSFGRIEDLRSLSYAALLLASGQAGDLYFSNLKRAFGIKDFSAMLRGKGGLLDRADSLILPLIVTLISLD